MASSTMYTYLGTVSDTTFTKLCDIKDFPDLGGAPEQIETTTLSNKTATFVNGVQSLNAFEFTANYDADTYDTLREKTGVLKYAVVFMKDGSGGKEADGSWSWEGELSVWPVSGGVNGVREMRISISVESDIEFSKTLTYTPTDETNY